ncbi:MAG TPA: di-heme-cytochrome C peroxidase [Terracidiphilus sp.]|nr:di-heme-cytochrome C peroxidase [Terracidiphilus sp.]
MVNFEQKKPNDDIDAAEIVRGILKVQAQFAAAQNRPLGRGTHTKGVCARATFEVFDLSSRFTAHSLVKQLAQGIFAKPGVYPATVRFANAASTIYPDRKPDLRAMSFSVELPPEIGGNANFQDYSLQSNPTFPINDSHTFAILMKVLSAGSGMKKLKAIWSLSLLDFFRFSKAAAIGVLQEQGNVRPYQLVRYWSTVPFRNGPLEAVKFSAIPRERNPAHELQDEPDAMRDELIRHLNEDEMMSSFDFAIQLLDTDKMTRWGFHRAASFWVENANVEWKESQSPFHVVARLTLVAKSAMEIAACEPRYIDVTNHATADSQPLGSINRARWASEEASRKVRSGEATADEVLETLPTAPAVHPSILGRLLRFAAFSFVALLVMYFVTGAIYSHFAIRNIPPLEHVDATRYLDQGWGFNRESPSRELYYYTAQGAGIHGIRYRWFVNLERPFRKIRFADPDHMRSLNFIVDPAQTPANPDQLPVGFARRYDDTIKDDVVDITCAACHTGQLNVTDKKTGQTTAIRIDGGESMAAFTDVNAGSFQLELGSSVLETLVNPLKFTRFARRILEPNANSLGGKIKLWRNLAGVSMELGKTFVGSSWYRRYPVQEGYGRTDALTRIGNVVFGDHVTSKNYHIGSAPVSYPYLWNIWKFNWVQYNASVSEPLARNVSEALGVGAKFQLFDDYGRPLPPNDRYQTSVAFENLTQIEATLQKLKPPRWPEDLLGPIDHAKADKGKLLFEQLCVRCHGPHVASEALKNYVSPGRLPSDPMWDIRTVDKDFVGTDPTEANNFFNYRIDLTRTGITVDEVMPMLKTEMDTQKARYAVLIPALKKEIAAGKRPGVDQAMLDDYARQLEEMEASPVTDESIAQALGALDMRALNAGDALNMVGMMIRHKYYRDHHITFQTDHEISGTVHACFAGFDALDIPQVTDAYKPRPLEGVWATPPFLHNGSVPNLYEMLSPIEERSKRFYVGRREFDPVRVGYVTEPGNGSTNGFWMDTTLPGNLNTGHQFRGEDQPTGSSTPRPMGVIGRGLTPEERLDIIEYLKIHKDSPDTPERTPADCAALLQLK